MRSLRQGPLRVGGLAGGTRPAGRAAGTGLRGYAKLLGRVFADSVWRFKRTVIVMIVTGLLALSMQAAAIGVAVLYAQRLQDGGTFELLGRDHVVSESVQLLALVAVAAGGLLILSAILTYVSFSRVVKLRQDYETFCAARVFIILGSSGEHGLDIGEFGNEREITGLVRRDARMCGRALGIASKLLMPLATLVLAGGALLVLAPVPTIIIAVIVLASAPWVLRVNREAAQSSRDLEDSSALAGSDYKRAVRWLSRAPFSPDDPVVLADSVQALPNVQRQADAYSRRLLATERAGLVSGIASASALLALVVTLGAAVLREDVSVGVLLAYLVIMGRAIASFRAVNRNVSAVNRFYPQVKRYFSFLDMATSSRRGSPDVPDRVVLHPRPPALPGSSDQVELAGPGLIAVVTAHPLTRYSMPRLVHLLLWDDPDSIRALQGASSFASGSYDHLPAHPLRESLGIVENAKLDGIEAELRSLSVEIDHSIWPPDLDVAPTPDQWQLIGEPLRFAFAVLSVARSSASWVFLDERSLKRAGPGMRRAVLERLSDRLVLIVREPGSQGEDGETCAVVLDDTGVAGIGDPAWAAGLSRADLIARGVLVGESVGAGGAYDESEDEFDE